MSYWPRRLFTTAPPTPSGGSALILPFRVPPRQQDLEDAQNPSQPPPTDTASPFLSHLSQVNLQIYNNSKGNHECLWPKIAEEIYNLQKDYGDLIIFVPGSELKPKYKCGICNKDDSTSGRRHPHQKRRWDLSPDILAHGPNKIKPWYAPWYVLV